MKEYVSWLIESPFIPKLKEELTYSTQHSLCLREGESISFEFEESPKFTGVKDSKIRPHTFTDYVGQQKVKYLLSRYISAMKQKNSVMPHTLIHGLPGTGKTTLAKIIASELGVSFVEIVASSLYGGGVDLINIIRHLNGGILFIDEIHGVKRHTAELLYTIMEDFSYNGEDIPKFTLIGATTEYGEMLKTRKPFCDRFKLNFELESYSEEDIENILKKYNERVFKMDVDDNFFRVLSMNCRVTPRLGIRLLESSYYLDKDYETALRNFSIVKNGYTEKDVKVMDYLNTHGDVGIENICSYLQCSRHTFLHQIEPYLLSTEMILRTKKGRVISAKGIDFLASL